MAHNTAFTRIRKELSIATRSDETNLNKFELVNDDWTHLKGEVAGPPETPYEGGKFIVDIEIPQAYPFHPPKVLFVTKVWHPNISSVTGEICLDVLKNSWVSAMNIRTILLSLQALLSAPEPDDPQDAFVASQYKDKYSIFEITAKHWTSAYAGGPHKFVDIDAKVKRLKEMGIDEHDARVVLSKENWDLDKATEYLFS